MQMSVSHSVLKRILIIYYEILIIKQEKRERFCSLSFFYILFLNNEGLKFIKLNNNIDYYDKIFYD